MLLLEQDINKKKQIYKSYKFSALNSTLLFVTNYVSLICPLL